MKKLLIHPFFMFSLVWFGLLWLYSLHWSNILIFSFSDILIFFSGYIYVPFCFGILFSYTIPVVKKERNLADIVLIVSRRLKYIVSFFVVGTLIEIVSFKGFPLIWMIVGDSRGYVEYGFSSFHGLLNAIHLSLILIYFYKAITKKSSFWPLLILLIWCCLMFSRFLIMISVVQMFFLYIQAFKVNLRRMVKVGLFCIFILWGFGLLGSLRSDITDLSSFFGITENYPDFLSPIFIWVYIYITSPLNNLVSWADINMYNYTFPNLFSSVVPSVIRGFLFPPAQSPPPLVHEAFNMSTGYSGVLYDMGVTGVFLYSCFIGGWIGLCWRVSRGLTNFFSYSVSLQCVFYLIFFNPLFTLPILFQYLIFKVVIRYKTQ